VTYLNHGSRRLIYPKALDTNMETPDVPDSCLNGDHDFGQAGRCRECGVDRVNTESHDTRRTGGAGMATSPLTDEEYRDEMDRLTR